MSYVSDESGRDEIYLQPYPGPGGKRLISNEGGIHPVWSFDGRELFYRVGDKVMVVEIRTGSVVTAGKPRLLFEEQYVMESSPVRTFSVSPDGRRFVMLKQSTQAQLNIILNWTEELKRLVPTN